MLGIIDFKELGERLIFDEPIEVLRATRLDEVKAVLRRASAFQERGCYVVGYVSYEASPAFDSHFKTKGGSLNGEDYAVFMVFDKVKKAPFVTEVDNNYFLSWESLVSRKAYDMGIATVKENIRQGNTYQVNYTMPLVARGEVDTFAWYNQLTLAQGSSYNAYIKDKNMAFLSLSPELFFKKKGNRLITCPMKGTAKRGLAFKEDCAIASWLAKDTKNLAENMMITDLLRNDMGKISKIDSVEVTHLTSVERYHTVWQMTSTIESELKEGTSLEEIFTALFPCGSITGAPKVATMAIIDEIEPYRRGLYCGTMGILLPDGDMIFNVCIRTIQANLAQKTYYYGVGGGITWDSMAEDEYQETINKRQVLDKKVEAFSLFTTGRVSDGKLFLREGHFSRLRESSAYFLFPYDEKALNKALDELLEAYPRGDYRLKISLFNDGRIDLSLSPYESLKAPLKVTLKKEAEGVSASPYTYFKTSKRLHREGEAIYYNEAGELSEGSYFNLILEIDGKLYTPKRDGALLFGLGISDLVAKGEVIEKTLTLKDLERAKKCYGINALRGIFELLVN